MLARCEESLNVVKGESGVAFLVMGECSFMNVLFYRFF